MYIVQQFVFRLPFGLFSYNDKQQKRVCETCGRGQRASVPSKKAGDEDRNIDRDEAEEDEARERGSKVTL